MQEERISLIEYLQAEIYRLKQELEAEQLRALRWQRRVEQMNEEYLSG